MAVHTAFQLAGIPPGAYPMLSRPGLEVVDGKVRSIRRHPKRRIQGLSNRLTALPSQAESPLNVNPIQPNPTSVLGRIDPTYVPPIAGGEVHQIEPIQLRFTMGQRWLGFALVGLLAFSFFRK